MPPDVLGGFLLRRKWGGSIMTKTGDFTQNRVVSVIDSYDS